ncbi:MAG: AAA family ATPase [Desulfobacteraceae bacterium]|nr:MAG: AAA family ATPase [Desulfobacteraceae bacterium]
MNHLLQEMAVCIRSRYPILYLVTSEETRAETLVKQVSEATQKDCFFWTGSEGFYNSNKFDKSLNALDALQVIFNFTGPGLFILKDFHPYLEDHQIVRKLRDLATHLRKSYKTLILISPLLILPPGLEKDISPIDIPLPTADELKKILLDILDSLKNSKKITIQADDALIEKIINAARGLTLNEAENLFAKLIIRDQSFNEQDLPFVLAEKKKLIRKSGLLEYYAFSENMDSVGGLDKLKIWLAQRGTAFSQKARDFGLPEPKGMLLLGVQGCGKSLAAKATSALWSLPLLKLDMGKIFDAYLGSSEKNIREAIRVAEAIAPNILWLDEIDKAFSGMGSPHSGDFGSSARVFGTFLTWMQEKSSPVFVLATANNIENLPPELIRKGRFDEIFFIDLPTNEERRNIFEIHFKKRKRDPVRFDLDLFTQKTVGFTGSEIEQLVISALYRAFAAQREIENKDILLEIEETVPLSVTYQEKISALRQWAEKRARSAS